MLPILLDLKYIKIYTFGVFLVLAFFWASFFLWRLIRLTSYKEEEIFDGLFLALFGSLMFGRLTYVVLHFSEFGFDVLKFILINGYPGLSLYGSIFGGILVLYAYFFIKKISFKEVVDYFIPPLYLALGFGKLGSFFSGTDVGAKTKFIIAVKYAGYDGLRHITPIYESILFFLGAYLSYKILFEIRKEKYSNGFTFALFLWTFSLIYLVFDKLKDSRLYLGGISFNFIVSLIMLLTGSFYFLYYFRHLIFQRLEKVSNLFKSHVKTDKSRSNKAVAKKAGE